MQGENNHMVKCLAPYLIKELQIKKKKRNEIPVVLEWLKSRTLKTSNCCKDVEQHELTLIDDVNAKCYSNFGRISGNSYKTKHNLTILSSTCGPRFLPKWVENLPPHKDLHMKKFVTALFIAVTTWK